MNESLGTSEGYTAHMHIFSPVSYRSPFMRCDVCGYTIRSEFEVDDE